MTDIKALTAPAAALTVTSCEALDYGRTTVNFSDGSTAIMIQVGSSGYSLSEARKVYGRTTYLAGNCMEVALPCATEAQWEAFERSVLEDYQEIARQEEQHRLEQYNLLQVKVEELRRDFTLPRIPALEKLKGLCYEHDFGYLFSRIAPTI